MRVRRIPNETDAFKVSELKDLPVTELPEPIIDAISKGRFLGGNQWQVHTQNGWISINDTDYLLVDTSGVVYPVPSDVFETSYEILDESSE